MNDNPTDRAIIKAGVALLQAGVLASTLPDRLMKVFGISAARAGRLAREALEKRRNEGRKKI